MRKVWLVIVVLIACGGLEPEPICAPNLVGLCGTLRFRGTVPDSTDAVFIAAYLTLPQTCSDLIDNRRPVIPGSVPYTDSTQRGVVSVSNGPAAGDIDFVVNFDSLRPATDFVTCTAQ